MFALSIGWGSVLTLALVMGLTSCATASAQPPRAISADADILSREKAAKEAYKAAPFLTYDQDGDGALNRDEWRAKEWTYRLIYDRDGNGALNFTEFLALECGEPKPSSPSKFYVNCVRVIAPEFRRAAGSYSGAFGADDARRQADRYFRANDRNNDGVVTEDEYRRR